MFPTTKLTFGLRALTVAILAAGATACPLVESCADYDPLDFPCTAASLPMPATGSPVALSTPFELVDRRRSDKVIPVFVRAPQGCPGPHPVVLFSHGGGFDDARSLNEDKNRRWGQTLAQAGYIVLHISHQPPANRSAVGALCRKFGQAPGNRNECIAQSGEEPVHARYFERPADAMAVIQDMLDPAGVLRPALQAAGLTIAEEQFGLIGWSAGTQAVLTLAGAWRKFDGVEPYQMSTDPLLAAGPGRASYGKGLMPPAGIVRAFVALSPQGAGFNGYFCGRFVTAETPDGRCNNTANSFRDLEVPLLVVTGSEDTWHSGRDAILPETRRQPFDTLAPVTPPASRYLLFLGNPDAGHGAPNLSQSAAMPAPTDAVRAAAIALFDSQLKSGAMQTHAEFFINRTSGNMIRTLAESDPQNLPASDPRATVFLRK